MERSGCQGSEELENLASHGSPNALQADCTCEETVFLPAFPGFFNHVSFFAAGGRVRLSVLRNRTPHDLERGG